MDTLGNSNFILKYIDFDKLGYQTLLLGALIFLSLVYFISRKKRNLPPGPYGVPYLGYLPFLGKKPHETLTRLSKKYGTVFSLNLGHSLVVVLNDWEAVKEAFSKSETANRPEGIFDIIPSGVGFGGVNGAEWGEQRRFSMKAMKDLGFGRTRWEELVQEELREVVQMIKEHGTKPLDVRKFFTNTFTNNVMTLMFGQRLPIGHPDTDLVSRSVDAISNSVPALGLNSFLPRLNLFLIKLGLTTQSFTYETLVQFSDFIKKTISKMKDNMKDGSNDSFVDEYINEMRRNEAKKKETFFSDKHLHGNTQALLFGGSETSRSTLIYILIAMAEHQEVQKRVQEELDNVMGKEGTMRWADRMTIPYTYATIMEAMRWRTLALLFGGSETSRSTLIYILISMAEHQEVQKRVQEELDNVMGKEGTMRWADRMTIPYTYATIMEAMRWKTLVPVNSIRLANEDIKISGFDIPKGTSIISNHWALHNDPKYWREPEKFVPDRFLLDDGKQVNLKPDSYAPFSYGKRACPGELIAMMEILLYFTTLMQKFTVVPEEGQKVKYGLMLGLTCQATDAKLRFIPRE
ncbi:cytochrome P450 2J4-like [Uloborus diversus]|uniref:cytochrome P450 2J4-like n=1 Tax=Uloborus diversus TaxID=327109 RepID=UPI00240A7ABE|nr:cytochrome P450 2J4-like [Uloborus diversus]